MNIINKVHGKIIEYTDGNCIKIRYNVREGNLRIYCPKSFEDRAIKTTMMFMQAFELIRPQIHKDFAITISVDDFYRRDKKVFAYACDKNTTNVILIPDFCFWNWKESGMNDYEEMCNEMLKASQKQPVYNKLFWIGNVATHPSRSKLCEIAQSDNRIEAYGMNWVDENGKIGPTKFVSLIDHTKYKYLIDIQGRGYSGRVKMLMFSGRPLFIADRRWKEYWTDDLVPFVHYIPVKEDLSDLKSQLDWAENNPEKASEIAQNAQNYASHNLRRKNAIEHYAKSILDYANKGTV